MMYTLARLFIFLTPLFFIAGCNQNNEVTDQVNTDQSTESTENRKNTKASAELSTTKSLQGTVNGKSFQLDKATLDEQGILTLKQGEEFFPELAVILFLFPENSSQALVDKRFDVNCQDQTASFGDPHLHMRWMSKDAEGTEPKSKSTTCGYNLHLKFGGKQGDDVIPAKLKLQSEKFGINLSGSFEVEVE